MEETAASRLSSMITEAFKDKRCFPAIKERLNISIIFKLYTIYFYRIFMAPKFDERGNPWLFRDQKLMFIELDKFKVNCE